MTDENLNVICCCKGEERYVVMFEARRRQDAVKQICSWAVDSALSLSLRDAEEMCEKIRGVDTNSPTE